jgi:inorganic pyrophosphatase
LPRRAAPQARRLLRVLLLRHHSLPASSVIAPGGWIDADGAWCEVKEVPVVDVIIEIPRGSFLKRGSKGHVDFVSPLPCPFNYGAVPTLVGLEGDLLDVVVLGQRLNRGTHLRLPAWGAVVQCDRGMVDHKLICSAEPPGEAARRGVLRFFRFYAGSKGLLNLFRGRPGRNACEGWIEAGEALACAKHRDVSWRGPTVKF